jgi:hypothetical protein
LVFIFNSGNAEFSSAFETKGTQYGLKTWRFVNSFQTSGNELVTRAIPGLTHTVSAIILPLDEAYNIGISWGHSMDLYNSTVYQNFDMTCVCPGGKYENHIFQLCAMCAAGTFSLPGATSCSPCVAGTYSSLSGQSFCSNCLAGTSSSIDATSCQACSAGTYSSSSGELCIPCAAGTFSLPGATSCSTTSTVQNYLYIDVYQGSECHGSPD